MADEPRDPRIDPRPGDVIPLHYYGDWTVLDIDDHFIVVTVTRTKAPQRFWKAAVPRGFWPGYMKFAKVESIHRAEETQNGRT